MVKRIPRPVKIRCKWKSLGDFLTPFSLGHFKNFRKRSEEPAKRDAFRGEMPLLLSAVSIEVAKSSRNFFSFMGESTLLLKMPMYQSRVEEGTKRINPLRFLFLA